MAQRTALTVAMVLTTFVLLIAAGVIGRLAIAPPSTGSADVPVASGAPSPQGFSEQQEAEYQQMLQTANARLEQANRQLEDAYRRLTPQPSAAASVPAQSAESASPAAGSPSPEPVPFEPSSAPLPSAAPSEAPQTPARITTDQAAANARAYVGGGTIERVRLEEEHGQLVYEVRFTNDSRVYIDPVSGNVIYARLGEDDGDDSRSGKDD